MKPIKGMGKVLDAGTVLRGITGYAAEGLLIELAEAAKVTAKRLDSEVYLRRAASKYPEMGPFLFANCKRAVHPDEIVRAIAESRGVKQIHAFNWNQIEVE